MSRFKMTRIHRCQDIAQLISESQDRKLTLIERICLFLHLCFCDKCKRFNRQIKYLRELMNTRFKHGESALNHEALNIEGADLIEIKNKLKQRLVRSNLDRKQSDH